ncbi:lysophospholipid acyltransferase family protein, partial [Paracandidimonas soli]|uniref:lysophospholipid acyltransferase family protein n=1 Tax=Paracandidimonas soli TaxID=1917182 RepID=UPI003340BB71
LTRNRELLNPVRFILRMMAIILWIPAGLIGVCLFPLLPLKWRLWMNHHWSRCLMWFCGVRIVVQGSPVMRDPVFWVANHVSWVDIFVLNSVRTTSFVAKSDIRNWPVIGWLVAGAGTVFIARGQRHAIRAVGEQMKQRFARGEVVGLFPEGTTSPGFDVSYFHTSLFEPAIRAGVDIQPVALRFYHRGTRSDRIAFVGEQTLAHNVWCLLSAGESVVEAEFLPLLDASQCQALGRAQVAERMHAAVRAAVRKGLEDDTAPDEDAAGRPEHKQGLVK